MQSTKTFHHSLFRRDTLDSSASRQGFDVGIVGQGDIQAVYNASKGAVRIFTKSAAVQYASEGIRVNSVHPGSIDTPMTADRQADAELQRQADARHPLGRTGAPDDVAYGVLYLASDESSFVTGSELVIDGGFLAQ